MKNTYKFTVPPTHDVGSYSGTCSTSYGETRAQSALWDYNSARAHDGLPPLSRMPAGTVYRAIKPATPHQPKTGAPCSCKRGVHRDNCPVCEGTGWRIDFAAIRARH